MCDIFEQLHYEFIQSEDYFVYLNDINQYEQKEDEIN
jgi:hypothetical protein